MALTTTGSFHIGFRKGGSDWQKNLPGVIEFARANDLGVLDTDAIEPAQIKQILDSGLKIGSVDLLQPWSDLMSPDDAKRHAAADKQAAYVRSVAALGVRNFFTVMIPEDPARKRNESLALAVDGYGRLCQAVADTGAKIVLEGWPGGAPHYAVLACTPESCREVLKELPGTGINFDPSHLIRMGIDPLRFVGEFGARIYHMHGKDTELFPEGLYECGNLQTATVTQRRGWGGYHWRYAIPGHGEAPWKKLLSRLAAAGYRGAVCIELEDENYNGTEAGEKRGLTTARDFSQKCLTCF